MYSTITTSIENSVCTITINRPDKLNALNKTVFDELEAAMELVYNDTNIKAAIITGAGSKAFVAGADISEFLQFSQSEAAQLSKRGQDVFFKIEHSPKPIIAAVNGFALGGGCELAMACHFRYCSTNAKFGQPEVNLGLIAGYGGTQRLTQLIGKGRSMELHLTGNMIDANEAYRIGLVNKICEPDALLAVVLEVANSITLKAPVALAKAISCINIAALTDSAYTNGQSGFDSEVAAFAACFVTDDMKEGVTAFLEKRKANFIGK